MRFFLLFFLLGIGWIQAHQFPDSSIFFYVKEKEIQCKAKLPVDELYMDAGFDFEEPVEEHGKLHHKEISEYLLDKIHVSSPSGKLWKISFGNFSVINEGNFFQYVCDFTLTPPAEESIRKFIFQSRAIIETQVSHSTMMVLQSDPAGGMDENSPKLLGTLRFAANQIAVDLGEIKKTEQGTMETQHAPSGFQSAVRIGMHHIAEGTDHLLFLLTLLLPAPLLASMRRWSHPSPVRQSFFKLLKIVTAFTIGHSCTLLLAAFGMKFAESKWVETCIAVSIVISAWHAIQPLFANRETWIAGGFGLIHGAAFAGSIVQYQMNLQNRLLTLLGFNLGIEIMQTIVVVLTIPWLLILSRGRWYPWLKNITALFAITAASSWIIERVTEKEIGWQKPVESLAAHPWYLLLGMMVFSIASEIDRRRHNNFSKAANL